MRASSDGGRQPDGERRCRRSPARSARRARSCRRSAASRSAARSRRRSRRRTGAAARRRRRSGPCPATSRCRTRTRACRCRRRSRRGRARRRTRRRRCRGRAGPRTGPARQPMAASAPTTTPSRTRSIERVGEADGDLERPGPRRRRSTRVVEQQPAPIAETPSAAVSPSTHMHRRHARRARAQQRRTCRPASAAGTAGSRRRPARGWGSPPPSTGPPCSRSRRASRPRCPRRSSARPGARPWSAAQKPTHTHSAGGDGEHDVVAEAREQHGPGRLPRGDDGRPPRRPARRRPAPSRARRKAVTWSSEGSPPGRSAATPRLFRRVNARSAQERRDVDLVVADLERGPLPVVDPRTAVHGPARALLARRSRSCRRSRACRSPWR